MKLAAFLFSIRAPAATILIRLMVGAVFLSEGIQKFLFPDALGVGRFVKIGIPYPEVMAPFVGAFEIGCGALIVLGLLTRLAAIPMIINMVVVIVSTKIPILLGHGYWLFSLPKANSYGFWSMAHEARTDFSMILGAIFLLIVGAGWKYHQAHPNGPYIYGGWDPIPPNPQMRPAHARWLKQYLPLVEDGTWAYLEIADSDLFAKPLPKDCVASAFANRDLHLVLANYGQSPQQVETADAYVPADTPAAAPAKQWQLPKRSQRILRYSA